MFFARIFRRKVMKAPVRTLRIDGTKITLTPKPDDAELAAQALLESMAAPEVRSLNQRSTAEGKVKSEVESRTSNISPQTSAYYKDLSEKIRTAHEQERRAAMRYVAYCEEKLTSDLRPQTSDIAELERGLYKFQDCAEREGGELKQRWQKCLAELTVMEMESLTASTENQEINNEENKTN